MAHIEDAVTKTTETVFDNSPKANIQPEKIKDLKDIKAKAISFIASAEDDYTKNYKDDYNYYENLYAAKRKKADGVAPWRANYFIPIPHIALWEQLPSLVDGLVGDGDFFVCAPRPGKDDLQPVGEIWDKLLRGVYEDADLFNKVQESCLWAGKTGWGPVIQGWNETTKRRVKEGVEGTEITEEIEAGLLIEVISPHRVFPDPAAENKRELEYLPLYCYITRETAEGWTDKDGVTPDLKAFLKYAANQESAKRYRLYTVYTKKEFYWLVSDELDNGEKFLVRRFDNPNNHGNIPCYWTTWFTETNKIRGKGLVAALADLTEENNDIHNQEADNLTLSINDIIVTKKDGDITGDFSNIEPGARFEADDPQNDLVVKKLANVNPASFSKQEQIMGYVQRVTGTAAGIMSGTGNQGVNNKTATGAQILAYTANMSSTLLVKTNRGTFMKPMVLDGAELIEQFGLTNDKFLNKYLNEDEVEILREWALENSFCDDFDIVLRGETGYIGKQEKFERVQLFMAALSQIPAAAQALDVKKIVKIIASALNMPQNLVDFEAAESGMSAEDAAKIEEIAKGNGMTKEQMMAEIEAGRGTLKQFYEQAKANAGGQNGQG